MNHYLPTEEELLPVDANDDDWTRRDHYHPFLDREGKQHEVWQLANKISPGTLAV
jgi:hypothetical protein